MISHVAYPAKSFYLSLDDCAQELKKNVLEAWRDSLLQAQ